MHHDTDSLQKVALKGLSAGTFIGLIVGILIAGPQFHSWPIGSNLAVIAGSAALAAFAGYFVVPLLVGYMARGGGSPGGEGSSDSQAANLSHQSYSASQDHVGHHSGADSDHAGYTNDPGSF